MATTAADRSPDVVAREGSSMPSASIVGEHEIRELVLPPSAAGRQRSALAFAVAVVVTGVAAGVGGVLLGVPLHFVQHLAYGDSLDAVMSPLPPPRRPVGLRR
jgi:hypothetical protein